MNLDPEQAKLAEELRRALNTMPDWSAARRMRYLMALGVKNRKAEYTRDFGGEAVPEADSIAAIPQLVSNPLLKLLYLLQKSGDDICLDAPTARGITGEPSIGRLIAVLNDAIAARFVRRTAESPRPLVEADRHSMVGLELTEEGDQYLSSALHQNNGAASAAR